jgi:CHAT domain-containing protein
MLNARMIVLSSCFTGSGALFAGEGVLSLARAFLYSGSRSVVMSLWEVNDRSGTDIVKSFYSYLRKGNSKSSSLRKARLDYLGKSDQLQSHPYYWATMVVYGDDSPLYIRTGVLAAILSMTVLLTGSLTYIYFRKR